MTSWFLKDCPKCGGDLYKDPFVSGDIVKCIQCSLEIKLAFLYVGEKPARQGDPDMKYIKASATRKN